MIWYVHETIWGRACKFIIKINWLILQIVKAGSVGDCMFFIGSGTVCVATTNGQEIGHLEDGDHFGEIALILLGNKVGTALSLIYLSHRLKLDSPFSASPRSRRLSSAKFTFSTRPITKSTCSPMSCFCDSSLQRPTSAWKSFWRARRNSDSN